jgi:hypothetical protein
MQYAGCCSWVMFTYKSIITVGEGCAPLPLGIAMYCTLADSFGRYSKGGGRRCEIRHAGSKYCISDRRPKAVSNEAVWKSYVTKRLSTESFAEPPLESSPMFRMIPSHGCTGGRACC